VNITSEHKRVIELRKQRPGEEVAKIEVTGKCNGYNNLPPFSVVIAGEYIYIYIFS